MKQSRSEPLDWCKQRAMEYCDKGDLTNALASFMSDLGKHESTTNHPVIQMGVMLLMSGNLSTQSEMQKFIEGTN